MNRVDVAPFDGPFLLGAAVFVALVLGIGWRLYQRCPHCGGIVRRVKIGWRRCGHCGRQYRRGLKLR